jgi:predicted small lipoprotein YifL
MVSLSFPKVKQFNYNFNNQNKKQMKKVFAILTIAALTACGSGKGTDSTSDSTAVATDSTAIAVDTTATN